MLPNMYDIYLPQKQCKPIGATFKIGTVHGKIHTEVYLADVLG